MRPKPRLSCLYDPFLILTEITHLPNCRQYEKCGCENGDATKNAKIRALNNRSLCNFKLQNWKACEDDCNDAIKLDSAHCKAWGRRGYTRYEQKVRFQLIIYEGAADAFAAANHFYPFFWAIPSSPCHSMTLTRNLYAIKLPSIIHYELWAKMCAP